jgi:hypothetical protein
MHSFTDVSVESFTSIFILCCRQKMGVICRSETSVHEHSISCELLLRVH